MFDEERKRFSEQFKYGPPIFICDGHGCNSKHKMCADTEYVVNDCAMSLCFSTHNSDHGIARIVPIDPVTNCASCKFGVFFNNDGTWLCNAGIRPDNPTDQKRFCDLRYQKADLSK